MEVEIGENRRCKRENTMTRSKVRVEARLD